MAATGRMLALGRGVEQDGQAATLWLGMAARGGRVPFANSILGLALYKGWFGLQPKRDLQQAKTFFETALKISSKPDCLYPLDSEKVNLVQRFLRDIENDLSANGGS